MATSQVTPPPLTVLSAEEIRTNILRSIRNGLQRIGIANPLVDPGTDFYIEATAIGNELAVAMASIQVKADQLMPDTAIGDDLVRWAVMLKLADGAGGYGRRIPSPAAGFAVLRSALSQTLTEGDSLTDSNGLLFEVAQTGTYATSFPVRATVGGANTNHIEGDMLQWQIAPPGADSNAPVDVGGLSGGTDEEDDETLRQRVLNRLGNPPGGGNWAQVVELATEATPRVQCAFVYPAAMGPATFSMCVLTYPTATNKHRALDSTTLNSTVVPYIVGNLPEHIGTNIDTSVDVEADVSIGLNIPAAKTASPPGSGAGWLDGTPWPAVDPDNAIYYAAVTVATSSTEITLTARSGVRPTAGVTRVSWMPYSGVNAWTLQTSTVQSYVESPLGTFAITLDKPFAGIAVGDYVFPGSVKGADYMLALVHEKTGAFSVMGPGEKRSPILSREFRHPQPGTQWPNTLGGHILRALILSGDEVLDAQWYSRLPDSTGNYAIENINGSVGVPATVKDKARCFVPRRIAFYPLL